VDLTDLSAGVEQRFDVEIEQESDKLLGDNVFSEFTHTMGIATPHILGGSAELGSSTPVSGGYGDSGAGAGAGAGAAVGAGVGGYEAPPRRGVTLGEESARNAGTESDGSMHAASTPAQLWADNAGSLGKGPIVGVLKVRAVFETRAKVRRRAAASCGGQHDVRRGVHVE
jgi:hypothetical protein